VRVSARTCENFAGSSNSPPLAPFIQRGNALSADREFLHHGVSARKARGWTKAGGAFACVCARWAGCVICERGLGRWGGRTEWRQRGDEPAFSYFLLAKNKNKKKTKKKQKKQEEKDRQRAKG
jgi:hypothetical protein